MKACVWRGKGFTPTKGELFRRHLVQDKHCDWCEVHTKSSWNTFIDSEYARECWMHAGLFEKREVTAN